MIFIVIYHLYTLAKNCGLTYILHFQTLNYVPEQFGCCRFYYLLTVDIKTQTSNVLKR